MPKRSNRRRHRRYSWLTANHDERLIMLRLDGYHRDHAAYSDLLEQVPVLARDDPVFLSFGMHRGADPRLVRVFRRKLFDRSAPESNNKEAGSEAYWQALLVGFPDPF